MKEKVFIEKAGCNRRMLDLKTIGTYLQTNDYELVDHPEEADKILVATCAFKKAEEDDSVQRLRHFKDYGAKVVVFGCLPDIAKERYEEFSDIPKVAPREIQKIELYFPSSKTSFSEVADSNVINTTGPSVLQSIANLVQTQPKIDREFWHRLMAAGKKKIADIVSPPQPPFYLFICRGCLGKCTYCGIRFSIGTVHSKPIAAVVEEFYHGVKEGFRQFTVIGDDPGCYGIDLGSSLPALLQELFTAANDVRKHENGAGAALGEIAFYLNEIHPKFLIPYTDTLLAMDGFSAVRGILCPVQSGSDRILEIMQREHTARQFEEMMTKLHAQLPKTVFTTQLIIGFPSETEEDFHNTLDLVVRCKIDYAVISPYHDKDRTGSSQLPDKVPAEVIQKRMNEAFRFFKKAGVGAYYNGGHVPNCGMGR
jgi:threonylcarbamoyladenosine tRNA methylthiotransferase CDKAL1